jgi:pimeloyl-ACP methyl ester carboxylesterase
LKGKELAMVDMGVNVRDGWVDVGGVRTHYLAAGEAGSPVLLLHGGGLDSASLTWRLAIGPLAAQHRVVAPDMPGYGESDRPDVHYSVDYYVGFLGHLIDALGLERASLVGLSLGGAIALGYALATPERVERLVLVDSHGLGEEIPYGALGYLLVHAPWLNEWSWAWLARNRKLVRRSLEGLVYDRSLVSEALVEEAYQLLQRPGVGAAWRALQRNETIWLRSRTVYVDRLSQVRAPTLILHGAGDSLVPVAWAERAQRLIPGARLAVVAGAKHWLPREKPEEFNRLVGEFLSS